MTCRQPVGLQADLRLRIDHRWTPEQAVAVFELITDLRDLIWSHYDLVLQEQYRLDRSDERPQGEPLEIDPDVPF